MPLKKVLFLVPLALFVLISAPSVPAADEATTADDDTLKKAGIALTDADLVAFLRKQTLPDRERRRIETLIQQLGDTRLEVREAASDQLLTIGVPALPFLRDAQRSTHREISRRALQCLGEINGGPDPGVTLAVVRSLIRRHPEETVAVLLDFYPFAGEEWLEEEVVLGIGRLGVKSGKPVPALLAALKDEPPARRAAAALVLARCGDLEQRSAVRSLLADPEMKVRCAAARGLLGDRFRRPDVSPNPEDRKLLRTIKVNDDAAALVAYFRTRTLSAADWTKLLEAIEDLESKVFATREEAATHVTAVGPSALPFLTEALSRRNSLDLTRRLEKCKQEIEKKGPSSSLPMAATRLLLHRRTPEAMKVLLDFVPFADDTAVEDEVLSALAVVATQEPRVPPELLTALKDEVPGRRGAAALLVGLVGDREQVSAITPLLRDDEARVRLCAAQGLLAARDREAVPALLNMLDDGPLSVAMRAEDLLRGLGGERSPTLSISDPAAGGRKKGHEAWAAWWRDNGERVELTGLMHDRPYLGLTLVAELSGGGRKGGGGNHRVWEFGRDDKARFELTDPINPIDAYILPGDRLLVAEYTGMKVTERDLNTKQIVWEHRTNGIVSSCQRLSNGNTFIATYNTGILEVTREGKEVYNFNPVANVSGVVNAIKMRNGQIACLTANGQLLELDTTGKTLRTTQLDNNGGWNGLEELPGGRLLVALQTVGKVIELDGNRKTVWECPAPGAVHAVRLPNGHVLVACGNLQKLIEVDQGGKVVWEKATTGRPFHVRRR